MLKISINQSKINKKSIRNGCKLLTTGNKEPRPPDYPGAFYSREIVKSLPPRYPALRYCTQWRLQLSNDS